MPKIKLICKLQHKFELTKELNVEAKDLTTFYYAIRGYFRTNLTNKEKSQIIDHLSKINDTETLSKIKRRKNIAIQHIFPANYYVEGVKLIGLNKYIVLWGT